MQKGQNEQQKKKKTELMKWQNSNTGASRYALKSCLCHVKIPQSEKISIRTFSDDGSENNSEPVGDSTTNLLEASKTTGKKSEGVIYTS